MLNLMKFGQVGQKLQHQFENCYLAGISAMGYFDIRRYDYQRAIPFTQPCF